MGLGASAARETVVQQIHIDQNDAKWDADGPSANNRESRASFASSLADKIRSASGSARTNDRQLSRLKNALDASEKKAVSADERSRALERHLSTLELRNNELCQEVLWLRQQLTDNPQIPRPIRSSQSSLSLSRRSTGVDSAIEQDQPIDGIRSPSVDHQPQIKVLNDKIRAYEEEIRLTKQAFQDEKQKLRQQLELQQRGSAGKVNRLQTELRKATEMSQKYEEILYRKTHQRSASADSTTPVNGDEEGEPVDELKKKLAYQQAKMSALSNTMEAREKELATLRSNLAKPRLAVTMSGLKKQRSALELVRAGDGDALKREIDAILNESTGERRTQSQHDEASRRSSQQTGQRFVRPGGKLTLNIDKTPTASPREGANSIQQTTPARYSSDLTRELKRVVQDASIAKAPQRPKTASSATSNTRNTRRVSKAMARGPDASSDSDDIRATAGSAPTLFKARRRQSMPVNADDGADIDRTEVMSVLSGGRVSPLGQSAGTKTLEAIKEKSRTKGSNGDEGESSDEEIKRLFVGMQVQPSTKAAPTVDAPSTRFPPPGQANGSAKSRDSGLGLGESGNSVQLEKSKTKAKSSATKSSAEK